MQFNMKQYKTGGGIDDARVGRIVLAMLSFFLNNYDIKENVLWYIAQTPIYAGSIIFVSIFIAGKFGELHGFTDKIRARTKRMNCNTSSP